jgi:deoxyinosine 3'endonuclease (endonuclease V)
MLKIILLSGVLLFSGCSIMKQNFLGTSSKSPKWLDNPSIGAEGKISAVGCAKPHFKGKSYQKKLAVQRAIEQIAIQKQSKVQTVSLSKKSSSSRGYSQSYNQTSVSETNTKVSTTVKEYYEKKNKEICAWVLEK